MKILSDYHMHSSFSGDSDCPMEKMINSAINLGLNDICFTEHMDMDYEIREDLPKDFFLLDTDRYMEKIIELKDKYKDKISVKFGVEIGMQKHLSDKNSEYINSYPFDFVIASTHLIDKKDPYYKDFYEGKSAEDVIRKYFEQTYQNLMLFDDFDVLGHLDYIVRYIPFDFEYEPSKYMDIIDEILKIIIKKGRGLDINTKALTNDNNSITNPCKDILVRYKELGGKIITFGSDAHSSEKIANHFDIAKNIAIESGFNEYCTYQKREPAFHKF